MATLTPKLEPMDPEFDDDLIEERSRYLLTPTDMWAMRQPRSIMPGFMFERSVGVVVSEPHVGKTLILMDLAIALASGGQWLHWTAPRPMPALIYAMDSPDWESCEQARNLMAGRGLDPNRADLPLLVAGRDRVRNQFGGGLNLMDDRHFRSIVGNAKDMGAKLIGLDALSEFHDLDENSRVEMKRVMGRMIQLATETGAHVLALHHTPVGGRMARTTYAGRGSSVIAASADLEIHLAKRRDGSRLFDILKGRGSDSADDQYDLLVERVAHPEIPRAARWRVRTEDEKPTADNRREVVTQALMAAAGPLKRTDLAAALTAAGMATEATAYAQVGNILSALGREGLVTSPVRGVWTWCG